ncbi:MAG TPA: hypothetical protein VFD82_15805 [Planctomycetota bacterium]|nr:hypothetical protein [Planctomycetota bacterium]
MDRALLPFLPLSLAAFAAALPAQKQIAESVEAIQKRVQAGGELIEMQWRRGASGRLSTCPKGSDDWQPLVQDKLAETFEVTGAVGFLMTWLQGDNDVLGMTDGERHLQRGGVGTADAELRTFLATPLPSDADARHGAALDRMVAIDLLRRRGVKSAIEDLGALMKREDLPPALRRRAQDAIGALQGGTRALYQLDPATLPLPVAADAYVIFDNGRIPDLSRLADLGRRLGMLSSLAVIKTLKAPSVEDCRIGQTESDAIGEMAFEFVRRFGNTRINQYCAALQMQAGEELPVGVCLQAAGEFDVATLEKALADELRDSGVEIAPKDGTLTLKAKELEILIEPTRFTSATKAMRGRPRPELAKQLLALGNAGIRVVLPANSKAWLAIAALELPPALDGELTVTFQPEFVVRAAITARDEDAAEAWQKRVQALLAEYVPMAEAQLTRKGPASPPLAELIAALKAIVVRADGKVVTVELTGKKFGWPTFEALVMSAFPH